MSDFNVVCSCLNVEKDELIEEIKSNNLKTVDDVADETGAGTGCGSCHCTIQEILDDVK